MYDYYDHHDYTPTTIIVSTAIVRMKFIYGHIWIQWSPIVGIHTNPTVWHCIMHDPCLCGFKTINQLPTCVKILGGLWEGIHQDSTVARAYLDLMEFK